MKKVFAEIGLGNDSFLSAEFEEGDNEHRVPSFIFPEKITELYFRLWIFKNIFILSSKDGFKIKKKDKNKLKVLFGVGGDV